MCLRRSSSSSFTSSFTHKHSRSKPFAWLAINVSVADTFSFDIVFIVQYSVQVIHAVDGLGTGLILVPVNGNFILKVYR